jgi:hypothetical protein
MGVIERIIVAIFGAAFSAKLLFVIAAGLWSWAPL